GLLGAVEMDLLDLAEAAEAPEVALEAARERAEVREECHEGPRAEPGEARVDAGAERRRDRPGEGDAERQRRDGERPRSDQRGEEGEEPDRVPLEREREIREERRRRLVHRLEEPAAEGAEVDDRAAGQHRRRELAVDAAEPARLAEHVEA